MPLGPAPQGGQAAVLGVHSAEGRPGEWADPGVTRGTAEKERLRSSLCSLAWTSLHSFEKERWAWARRAAGPSLTALS